MRWTCLIASLLIVMAAWADDDDHVRACKTTSGRTTVTCGPTNVTVVDHDPVCPAVTCACTGDGNHVCGKLPAKVCKPLGFRPGCTRCVGEP